MKQEEVEIILLKNLLREVTVKYDELIKKQKKILKKTFKEAINDSLTGLYNRKFFYENVYKLKDIAKRNNGKLIILFIDLDDFKKINDRFGHKKGDEVLKKAALILKKSLRNSDIISRMGGDEFVVAVLNGNEKDIDKLVKRARGKMESEIKGVSFSYGYSVYPDDGEDIEELIQKADERIYSNKRKRKNVGFKRRENQETP
ncbi:GGDEF domain-containing protein [Nautilia sp.]